MSCQFQHFCRFLLPHNTSSFLCTRFRFSGHHQAEHITPCLQSWQKCQHQISEQLLLPPESSLFPSPLPHYSKPVTKPCSSFLFKKIQTEQPCNLSRFHPSGEGVSVQQSPPLVLADSVID